MELDKILAQVEKYILYSVIFLFPITVLPTSPNVFVVPKLSLLVFGLIALLIIKSLRVISAGRLEWESGKFDLPVVILGVAYLASTILRTPNKMEAYLLPGTTTIVIGGVLVYFLVNQLKPEAKKNAAITLFASAAVYSLLTILSFSRVLGYLTFLPAYMQAQGFTPEGGFLPSAIFLAITAPLAVSYILSSTDAMKKGVAVVSTVLIILGLIISIYNLLPGSNFTPRFPGLNVSWSIAVDSLKNSPLLGVGPGNYVTAFNRFRPIEFNATEIWAIKFTTAGSFFMTMITETGMVGLAGFLLIIYSVYKIAKRDVREKKMVQWGPQASLMLISLGLAIIALLIFPATTLIIVTFFIILALNSKTSGTNLNLTTTSNTNDLQRSQKVASRVPALLLTVPVIIAALMVGFRAFAIARAEYTFNQSLQSLAANDVRSTYEQMTTAIQLNPFVDRYHSAFSRVNLAIANSIVTTAIENLEEGATVSDEDRQRITAAIQQAIQSSKNTVATNQLRAGNWQLLGDTYRAIMPLAQGADVFAAQSYRNAVALDPFNPNLRIALGGIFYAAGDYRTAVQEFERAVAVKDNFANAHYNLAYAYHQDGQLDRARNTMTNVLALITDRNSQDYQVARQALEDFQAEAEQAQAQSGEELEPPQEGEQILQPPVELPDDAQPPQSPITPTPIPADELTDGDDEEDEEDADTSPTPAN